MILEKVEGLRQARVHDGRTRLVGLEMLRLGELPPELIEVEVVVGEVLLLRSGNRPNAEDTAQEVIRDPGSCDRVARCRLNRSNQAIVRGDRCRRSVRR